MSSTAGVSGFVGIPDNDFTLSSSGLGAGGIGIFASLSAALRNPALNVPFLSIGAGGGVGAGGVVSGFSAALRAAFDVPFGFPRNGSSTLSL